MNAQHGKLITFEGPEGGGKSTQAEALAEALRAAGVTVLQTREPGGTHLAEKIRTLLKDEADDPPVDRAEVLLFLAARAQLVSHVIRPALARGTWVVCDRFCDSTFAYQGYGRGFAVPLLKQMNDFATQALAPDLTLLLDVPPHVSAARLCARQKETATTADRIECAGAAFHARLREGFHALAQREPERFAVVDATADVRAVRAAVFAAVARLGVALA